MNIDFETIKELTEIFHNIANDNSRTTKEMIIKANSYNSNFKLVLSFVYNDFIVTGISSKKINKEVDDVISKEHDFSHLSQLTNYLAVYGTGRDYDIAVVHNFINKLPEGSDAEVQFIKDVVTKSLKVGITATTINKVLGKGFIPKFSVMLAEKFEEKQDKLNGNFYVTLKIDGNRVVAIKENNVVKFFTRKGKLIDGLNEIADEFHFIPNNTVLDGELLLINDDNLTTEELFRATQSVVRSDGPKTGLQMLAFDIIPLDEFKLGESTETYAQRRRKLDELFESHATSLNQLQKLDVIYYGNDKSQVVKLGDVAEEQGFEGVMVNSADGKYLAKRTTNLLKVKSFKSADLICTGIEEGEGRNAGRLGAIHVDYKGNMVKVGSGFEDHERDFYFNNPDEIVGKIIQVKYFEESQNSSTGEYSLRFPVFQTIRFDKDGVEDVNFQ